MLSLKTEYQGRVIIKNKLLSKTGYEFHHGMNCTATKNVII